jgi:hypothetical protein
MSSDLNNLYPTYGAAPSRPDGSASPNNHPAVPAQSAVSRAGAAIAKAVTPTAFDQALRNQALLEAAENYALERANHDSPEYRAAWLRFRRQIRTLDDLERWQTYQRLSGRRRQTAGVAPAVTVAARAKALTSRQPATLLPPQPRATERR